MPSPTQITVSQLARLIGTPDCPVLIDVSIDADFNEDPYLIPSATRHPFDRLDELAHRLLGKKIIVICQKGLKLSEGVAAKLRTMGIDAQNLEGGNIGWRDAKQTRIPNSSIPWSNDTTTVWVTRHRPKIDRIACPWLIRRFIDPNAQFLFVAPSQVMGVAEHFNATPFDIEGVEWSHKNDQCTFDTMLNKFQLNSDPLKRLARIVRGADTDQHDLAPETAGLVAASLGLSRMYKDDLEQLEAGMLLYDSFYRWARDATSERHDWPATSAKG
jgi:rhodanese-related sulfurtransferase